MRTLIFIALAALAFSCTTLKNQKTPNQINPTFTCLDMKAWNGIGKYADTATVRMPVPTIEEVEAKFDILPRVASEIVVIYIGDDCCFMPRRKCRTINDLEKMAAMPEMKSEKFPIRVFSSSIQDPIGLLLYDKWSWWQDPHRPTPAIFVLKQGCRVLWPARNLKQLAEELERIKKF
ncbi:MAG: hypothetical protein RL023_705 [Candidatus Parcubacteria bacterium]|jgi:hypothetical protein